MSAKTVFAAVVALLLAIEPASAATVEKLAEPCRAFNVLAGKEIVDASGKHLLALTSSNETTHCQLLLIDYTSNEGRIFTAPAGSGAWSLNALPGDRLVVGTYYDGTYMIFDLKQMAFTKTVKIKGEEYIWNSILGGDGRLYGGTYPGGHLAALDLNTYQVEDLGCSAPPNQYLRFVSALPDGRLLCDLGMVKPARTIFDPKSHSFSPPPAQFDAGAGVSFQGCFIASSSWEGKTPAGSPVFKGDTLAPLDNPPFPTPPASGGKWTADLRGSVPDAVILRQGKTVWRCRAGANELEKVFEGDLKSAIVGQTPDGKLLCLRGQEYAVVSAGDRDLNLKPIPCEKSPRPSHWLRVDPKGRVWGGPQFGQTVFYFDPATGQTVNTGLVCDSGGEVYDGAFLNGKTYLVSYSGGDIIEFDPAQPWDQWHNKNPKTIHHLANEGYIRPIGGVQVGDDGKLYASWNARYGTYGGAISITDPADGKTELIDNPLGDQGVCAFSMDDGFIYAGTDLAANGLPEKKDASPSFGMIDRKSRRVVFQRAFDGAHGINHVLCDATTRRIVLTIDRTIAFFDPARKEFIDDLSKGLPTLTGGSLVGCGDGKAYYASDNRLLQLGIGTGKAESIAELPDKISKIALSPDGTIYITCEAVLYRIRK